MRACLALFFFFAALGASFGAHRAINIDFTLLPQKNWSLAPDGVTILSNSRHFVVSQAVSQKFGPVLSIFLEFYPDGRSSYYFFSPLTNISDRGMTRILSVSSWICSYNTELEVTALFSDNRGYLHEIALGDIAFDGWRMLHVRPSFPIDGAEFKGLFFYRHGSGGGADSLVFYVKDIVIEGE